MVSPVILIALPLTVAFSLPIIGIYSRKMQGYVVSLTLLVSVVISLLVLREAVSAPILVKIGGFKPPYGISLYVGALGALLALMISLVGFIVSLYNLDYIRKEPMEKYHMLFLLLVMGATGMVLTGDLFNLFVFLEITSISSYALTAYYRNRQSVEAAIKYIIVGSLSSTLVLIGIALIYSEVRTLNIMDIAAHMDKMNRTIAVIAFSFLFTGFAIESEIFPTNGWAPDAYTAAPSPISALFSGVVVKAGIYALVRIMFTIFGYDNFFTVLAILGAITLLGGEMAAMVQTNIKRMLAYSSIGQVGMILLAFGINTYLGVEAALFLVFNHAVIKSLLFLSAGYMSRKAGSKEITEMKGLARKMPMTSLSFALGSFAIMGLPPLNGFVGKFLLINAAVDAGFFALAVVVLIGSFIEAVYFLKVLNFIFSGVSFRDGRRLVNGSEMPFSAFLSVLILVMLVIFFGLYPQSLFYAIKPAARELLGMFTGGVA